MRRLTRRKDENECRINKCRAEEWMADLYHGEYPYLDICDNCPFEEYINRLAEMEDMEENMEDDRK